MYYGNDNYVGECSVKMEDMMYTDEKETVLQVTAVVLGDMQLKGKWCKMTELTYAPVAILASSKVNETTIDSINNAESDSVDMFISSNVIGSFASY